MSNSSRQKLKSQTNRRNSVFSYLALNRKNKPKTTKRKQIFHTAAKEERRQKERNHGGEYLESDNVLFLLLNEEGVEFVEFILEQVVEVGLLLGHVGGSGCGIRLEAFSGAVIGGSRRFKLFKLLLELLVGEELVAPLRQGFLDLGAEALSEFHGFC